MPVRAIIDFDARQNMPVLHESQSILSIYLFILRLVNKLSCVILGKGSNRYLEFLTDVVDVSANTKSGQRSYSIQAEICTSHISSITS